MYCKQEVRNGMVPNHAYPFVFYRGMPRNGCSLKYREAARTEVEVWLRLARHDVDGARCVQIRNWFDYLNHICIVFEKLGPSLYDFLRKNNYRSLSIDLVREFGRQLLESVAFMHHTDLKPENILLVSSEFIKVPDYKFLSRNTKDGSYFKNLPKCLGWNYDLWSVGCILVVELCSGEAVFQTHENLEHLAMMERVLEPLPPNMVVRVEGTRLSWPDSSTSRESMRAVWKLPQLPNLIRQHVDHSAGDLIDLLQGLLRYDPSEPLKAKEAMRHHFFFTRDTKRYGYPL
uniref:Protein kinase domain-containing protein n=1 Tax=Glycine max TaxID=3847 RepID=K7MYW2_SOYBN